jgi:hypothetical protein
MISYVYHRTGLRWRIMCHQRISFCCQILCHQWISFHCRFVSPANQTSFRCRFLCHQHQWTSFCYLILCHQRISFRCRILCHQQISFCCRCSMTDFHIRIDINACNEFIVWLCNMWKTWMWTCGFLKYVWWWVCDVRMQMCWFVTIYVIRLYDRDQIFDWARTLHRRNR